MYYFMDIFYALGFNLTKKICIKYGQMDNVEKKYTKYDEVFYYTFSKKYSKSKKNLAAKSFFLKFWKVVKLVQEALKEPEHTGSYDEYIELCKLYDKNENGTMMLAELENFLSNLGKLISLKENTPLWLVCATLSWEEMVIIF